MLERYQHQASWFITLTYDAEHLPANGSVSVREAQLFLKRIRKAVEPVKLRYFIVGEYGERNFRPHYHALLFGLPYPEHDALKAKKKECRCIVCQCWPKGMVDVGSVTTQSTAYVAGYVCKKMTKKDDVRLGGREPEFARMSLRPGIGAGAVPVIAAAVNTKGGAVYVVQHGDVPGMVRAEGSKWPLGRYLLRKVREQSGYALDDGSPSPAYVLKLKELQAELTIVGARDLREQNRLQTARRAESLHSINRSKKGKL